MSSNTGHRDYDENLLASAPVATKAQLQSGYNPDLLAEKATPPPRPISNLEAGDTSPVEEADHESMPPKVPFYRTRKGMIIIAVVVLVVIIAAAVGGGIAGKQAADRHRAANSTSSTQTSSNSTVGDPTGTGVPDIGTTTTTPLISPPPFLPPASTRTSVSTQSSSSTSPAPGQTGAPGSGIQDSSE